MWKKDIIRKKYEFIYGDGFIFLYEFDNSFYIIFFMKDFISIVDFV